MYVYLVAEQISAPCGEGVYLVPPRIAGAAADGGAVDGGLQLKECNLRSALSGLLQPGGAARMKRGLLSISTKVWSVC